ncbi:MAG: Gfo/Idh/MocA family protein [Verrucomicrobium sp.]|nr:Gfo/Idh/MocA family oxidoreductase [Verrucomicrobium sp.]
MNRRSLLKQSTALGAGLALSRLHGADDSTASTRKLRVAVVALGRGMGHVQALLQIPNVEIKYLAEVDSTRLDRGLKLVAEKQQVSCVGVKDFRSFLDDGELDAVFIATPNFWHTPAAVYCMKAGKHVYVEKPGSQNMKEAELIVAASKKYDRVVQMGNQRRTWLKEPIARLHEGTIGKVHYARAFYNASRKAVGQNANPAAADLDMDLWQGPVLAERDMAPYVHYDWHWLWHWGNGELGNNGIHHLDVLRWGLKADLPQRITYNGGRYWFDDKQETPDTGSAVFDFGDVGMSWEQSSCHPRAVEKTGECIFYGEGGSLHTAASSYTFYDLKGVEMAKGKAPGGDVAHIANFLEAIRGNESLNSPIEEGQKSTMLCHLGNIAYRTGTMVHFDPKTKKITGNPEAEKYLGRKYRKGWEFEI